MKKTITWILVASDAEAKLFRLSNFPHIEQIAVYDHPESRLLDQDLTSSKAGRNFDSTTVSRHAYEPHSDPKQLEVEKFAKFLTDLLATEYYNAQFHRLFIIAGPEFLGYLRKHLNQQLKDIIVAEVAKDVVKHNKSQVEELISNTTLN